MSCSAWDTLHRELDLWEKAGEIATFWWRDDDAVAQTPELQRLTDLCEQMGVPVALAAIPARLEPSLAPFVENHPVLSVLQHGYAHRSAAPAGVRKIEIGGGRSSEDLVGVLLQGRTMLETAFAARFVPVLVPPWNRIDRLHYNDVLQSGLRGLSTMWARSRRKAQPGLKQVNAHLDPINWRGGSRFVGEYRALGQLLWHLYARRTRRRDWDEPTGVLTHHLVQDDDVWAFCRTLMATINAHPAAKWLDAGRIWN